MKGSEHCPDELKDVEVYSMSQALYRIGSPMAPTQTWAEFGVGHGTSSVQLARELEPHGRFYLFDGWEGIPDEWNLSATWRAKKGSWKFPKECAASQHRGDKRIVFIDGWYKDTLPFDFGEQLGLVHFDCDVYSSTRDALQGISPFIDVGTVLIFDELIGYEYYRDHEYKALCEWREQTGFDVRWVGKTSSYRAVGVVH